MSIETTIGIISGIIAIVTAIIQLKNHYFSQRKQGKEPFIKKDSLLPKMRKVGQRCLKI